VLGDVAVGGDTAGRDLGHDRPYAFEKGLCVRHLRCGILFQRLLYSMVGVNASFSLRRGGEIVAAVGYFLRSSWIFSMSDFTPAMHLCLFEDHRVPGLRPLVETRAAYDLRLGVRTILETTREAVAPAASGLVLHTRSLVASVTDQSHENASINTLPDGGDVLFVNGRFVAENGPALTAIQERVDADDGPRAFLHDDTLVAAWVPDAAAHLPDDVLAPPALPMAPFTDLPKTTVEGATLVNRPWHLLGTLRPALRRDVAARIDTPPTSPLPDRPQASVHESAVAVRPDQIHVGTDATVRPGAILNAEDGPILIDEGATIHERAVLKGPCYVGPKSQVKVGADIDGAAFGYYCKVGGEVHDTVIHSLSNKNHPGFLGHAYLGRWCNLGADTNNSNLKNDYGEVSAYAPSEADFVGTGRQFAGLFMGDHSKCGINTMFNTGTVVGTCCNLFGGDFPPRYVPPFSWGGPSAGFNAYRLDKALSVAERVMARREIPLTENDRTLLTTLFDQTERERATHHE
jgi:UDP-N-acetylglucosamine diphosphorylase/glucosamine-1-phosphate N-acetyltransferase